MGPSGMQILVIAVVILLLFGGKKIPELAKGLGSGIKNFKKELKDDDDVADAKDAADKKIESKEETASTKKSEDTHKA